MLLYAKLPALILNAYYDVSLKIIFPLSSLPFSSYFLFHLVCSVPRFKIEESIVCKVRNRSERIGMGLRELKQEPLQVCTDGWPRLGSNLGQERERDVVDLCGVL